VVTILFSEFYVLHKNFTTIMVHQCLDRNAGPVCDHLSVSFIYISFKNPTQPAACLKWWSILVPRFFMPRATSARTISVLDSCTNSVHAPRGHHQAALQPFSSGHRWGSVCLARSTSSTAAVTGICERRRKIADFSRFYTLSLQNSQGIPGSPDSVLLHSTIFIL
jgi:hypothetical protein